MKKKKKNLLSDSDILDRMPTGKTRTYEHFVFDMFFFWQKTPIIPVNDICFGKK